MPARYPEIVEYNEAVQNPASAFRDPELRQGRIEINALGLPVAFSGGFALTYMMRTARRKLAVRCFLREIPAVQQKYAAIAAAVRALNSRYFVDFECLADGIALRGICYPVVKMDWAEGQTLGEWLEHNVARRRALARLREAFAALALYLEQHGIAHGDIQNGNVIVAPDGLKLVDYDGVYVPGMPVEFGCESGHRHFQHPGRTTAHFGPQIDRFSFIVTDFSLAALIEDPALYQRFRRGGEAILFHADDFADPAHSELLQILAGYPDLAASARDFAAICRADIGAVPSLADYRAGRNIPSAPAPRAAAATMQRDPAGRNRHLVARLLGNGAAARPAAAPAPARPQPALGNRAIVQALRTAAPPPPPAQPAAQSPPPRAPQLIRPAAPRPPQPMPAPRRTSPPPAPRARRIPKTGSFVIHPRVPPPPPPPPTASATAAVPPPNLWWERVLRFLGIDA